FLYAGTSRYVFTADVSVNEVQAFIRDLVLVVGWFGPLDRDGRQFNSFQKPVIDRVEERDLQTRLDNEGSPVSFGNLVEHPALEIRVASVQDLESVLVHADRLRIDFFLLALRA